MSGLKQIRRRLVSVRNTKQITRAMKLVSAAKLRRAQDLALAGRKFAEHLMRVLDSLWSDEIAQHPLLVERAEKKSRVVVMVAADRGLCGGYNTNIAKAVAADRQAGIETTYVLLGRRAVSFGNRSGWSVLQQHESLAEDASTWPVEEIAKQLVQGYTEGKIDEVVLYYTKFVSAMTQRVTRERLLPLGSEAVEGAEEQGKKSSAKQGAGVKTDPSPKEILEQLLPLLIRTRLRQAGLESKASEHAARMTAMDSATSNADELMAKLRLYYNRARQSAITRELLDIIGGAEAIK